LKKDVKLTYNCSLFFNITCFE